MTPPEAITHLSDLLKEFDALLAALRNEADAVEIQWADLGRVGGRRDDHAASLLVTLVPHLQRISIRCTSAGMEIERMKADPFGRNEVK